MSNDLYDFKSMLDLPQREAMRLRREREDTEWSDYGRSVYKNISAPGNLEKVICLALLNGRSPQGITKLIRIYLETGIFNVRD